MSASDPLVSQAAGRRQTIDLESNTTSVNMFPAFCNCGRKGGETDKRNAAPGLVVSGAVVILIVIVSLVLVVVQLSADPLDLAEVNETNPVISCCFNGAVASSNVYATDAAQEILQMGGNAFDAALAAQLVLTVAEPFGSGLGGGLLSVFYEASTGRVHALDAREEAPAALAGYPASELGGAPVGVPGTPAALDYVFERFASGKLTRKQLAAPAIRLARDGWVLGTYGAEMISSGAAKLAKFAASAALYLDDAGQPLPAGSLMFNPDIAATIETWARNGSYEFYHGEIAADIIAAVNNNSESQGNMTLADLGIYNVVEREPVSFRYRNLTFVSQNMPSSGGLTLGYILSLLDGFNLGHADLKFGTVDSILAVLNAMSVAYADRKAWMGDADWADVPVAGLQNVQYLQQRRQLVTNAQTGKTALNVTPSGFPPGAAKVSTPNDNMSGGLHTTHFSVEDGEGNMIAWTSTLENMWGSFLTVPGRGFLLNNELNDFSSSGPNRAEGGRRLRRTALPPMNETFGSKRPMSSMTPTLVFRRGTLATAAHDASVFGEPWMAVGSPGGWRIICSVLNFVLGLVDFGSASSEGTWDTASQTQALTIANALPRFATNNDGIWMFEKQFLDNKPLLNSLRSYGVSNAVEWAGGAVAVVARSPDGSLAASADARRDGKAVSF